MRNIILSVGLLSTLVSGHALASDPQDIIKQQNQSVVETYLNNTQTAEELDTTIEPSAKEQDIIDINFDEAKFDYFLNNTAAEIAADPMIAGSIKQAHEKHADIQPSDYALMDKQWASRAPELIEPYTQHVLSKRLQRYIGDFKGIFTEMFVMDSNGLNVAMSHTTSDFWQGDEAQFTEAYNNGEGGVYIGEPYFDESMGDVQIRASLPVRSYIDGEVIGAIAIGINPNRIKR